MDKKKSAFSHSDYETLFALTDAGQVAYAEELLFSLSQTKQSEIQFDQSHPFAELIIQGKKAFAALIQRAQNGLASERLDAIDALSYILLESKIDGHEIEQLRRLLASEKDKTVLIALAKTLAIAQDFSFLREQLARLTDDDPAIVAAAAQLLGYGRMQQAIEPLCALLSPSRIYESRHIIWALGEIGDRAALPYLHRCIHQSFRVNDALIALGKIACLSSISVVFSQVLIGTSQTKECGYRALARILEAHRKEEAIIRIFNEEFGNIVDSQLQHEYLALNWETRFFMIICLARFGRSMQPSFLRRYLDLSILSGEQLIENRNLNKSMRG